MGKGFKYATIIVVILFSLFILYKVKILFEGEKGKILRIIYKAKTATEKEDLFKCISFISRNYNDKYGNDRRSLFLIAQTIFDVYDNIVIGIRRLDISLDTDIARAQLEASGVARNIERKESNIFETETIKFIIFFQKEEEGWKVIKLEFLEPQEILQPGIT